MELRKVQLTTIEDRLGEIRSILDGGLSYHVKRRIEEFLVTQVKVTTVGDGSNGHIDAEVTFAFDQNALCSDYLDIHLMLLHPHTVARHRPVTDCTAWDPRQ